MWASPPPSYFLMKSSYVAQAALISWVSALFLPQPCEHLGLLASAILPAIGAVLPLTSLQASY